MPCKSCKFEKNGGTPGIIQVNCILAGIIVKYKKSRNIFSKNE
jgi:hypothetical protein